MKLSGKTQVNAAIAQSVERILGKDEVASSNLASSSKKKLVHEDGLLFDFGSFEELATSSTARSAFQSRGHKVSMKSKISWNRVASSNLASSSKELRGFDFGVLLLLQSKTGGLILCVKDIPLG